ncbi:hypothetical protein BDD12DRAFT_946309 [Trichophaea hybrida]|nr:hypothetical protein BDD12DRAFT_946309 [Trichophaea hybrida]
MADTKFIDLIFNPDFSHDEYTFAYRSLVRNPKQLFTLFLKRDISTEFFVAFDEYGKTLAELLGSAPEYHGETSDHPIQRKDVKLLYEESLAAFLYSLFPLHLPDAKSQESLAAIVMAVITIIPSGGCLQLIGAELSRIPPILTMLILDGSLGVWSRRKYQSFISLTSKNWTKWEPVVNGLVEQCRGHRRVESWNAMERFLQSFPCELCPQRSSAKTIENVPRRENSRIIHAGVRAFENLLGEHLGPWKVVISELALKSLRAIVCRAIPGEFELIRKGLQALASGDWMRGSLRRTISSDTGYRVPVYKVCCQQNVIIWQVDIAFDERHSGVMQVVKGLYVPVWAICASTEVEEMCQWVSLAQGSHDQSRIEACETVDLRKLKGTLFPKSVYSFDEHSSGGPRVNAWGEDCKTAEGSPILGKFFSLTSVVFDSLLQGASVSVFPIDPSEEELHVINHFKSPAFILGRSGTGKTTCLIYKLASRYLESQVEGQVPARQAISVGNQLLLTRSGRLTQKLKPYTKRLIDTRLGKFEDSSSSPVQENSTTWQECNEDTNQDIFSIGDSDFPLVCTFSHFLRLLENSFKLGGNRTRTRARLLSNNLRTVDYDAFRMDYWRRFPASLTRKVPIGLAFLDIMGVIKGSASRETNFEPLSREGYIYKRWKLAPNFATREGRDSLYTLYQHYEKYKKRCGEVDDIDRVVNVLKGLEQNPVLRREIESFVDEVYVDEVQDQRPLEIELLLSLIPDPRQIHFGSSSPRVRPTTKLMICPMQLETLLSQYLKILFFAFRMPKHCFIPDSMIQPPPGRNKLVLFRNYSHYRITTDLILGSWFPQLVDRLPPENGDNPGPEPTLYKEVGLNFLSALNGAKDATDDDGNLVSLGAHRAILVRDEQTRNDIKTKVENPELILTILESKGMEFEDVFLYDFFSTTPSSNFPVLEQLFAEKCNTRVGGVYEIDITLCSELKHLYVAITRAQNRLWIVESQRSDAVDSVIHLFNTVVPTLCPWRYPKSLLRVIYQRNFSTVIELQRQFAPTHSTTQAVWIEQAFEFMEQKNYEQAGDKIGEALASAYHTQVIGREHRAAGKRQKSVEAFEKACRLFLNAGRVEKAAQCQHDIENILAAAGSSYLEILSTHGRHKEAAWDFMEAGFPKKAAREYGEILDHEKVLAMCYYAGFPPSKINHNCRKLYARLCYLLMSQKKCSRQFEGTIRSYLGSSEEQETAAREFGMVNHVIQLQISGGRFQEACELAVNVGLLEEALSLVNGRGALLPEPVLSTIVDYVHAGRLIHISTKLEGNKLKEEANNAEKYYSTYEGEKTFLLDQIWMSLMTSLNRYIQSGEIPSAGDCPKGFLREFFILLAAKITPVIQSNSPHDLINVPLEIVGEAIGILKTFSESSWEGIQHSVLLFLGIYTPPKSGKFIAMPWSAAPILPKLDFPIQHFPKDGCEVGFQVLLEVIYAAFGSIEQQCRNKWQVNASELPGLDNVQWASDIYSEHSYVSEDPGKQMWF